MEENVPGGLRARRRGARCAPWKNGPCRRVFPPGTQPAGTQARPFSASLPRAGSEGQSPRKHPPTERATPEKTPADLKAGQNTAPQHQPPGKTPTRTKKNPRPRHRPQGTTRKPQNKAPPPNRHAPAWLAPESHQTSPPQENKKPAPQAPTPGHHSQTSKQGTSPRAWKPSAQGAKGKALESTRPQSAQPMKNTRKPQSRTGYRAPGIDPRAPLANLKTRHQPQAAPRKPPRRDATAEPFSANLPRGARRERRAKPPKAPAHRARNPMKNTREPQSRTGYRAPGIDPRAPLANLKTRPQPQTTARPLGWHPRAPKPAPARKQKTRTPA